MQNIKVSSGEDNKTATFKNLIIGKCQSLFELDKTHEINLAKKRAEINFCEDPVIFNNILINY